MGSSELRRAFAGLGRALVEVWQGFRRALPLVGFAVVVLVMLFIFRVIP